MQNIISDRLLNFAIEVIKIIEKLRRSLVGRQIAGQLLRSSTSAGANYEEASGAESRLDFVHKLQIVLKELRESIYWLRLIAKSGLLPDYNEKLMDLIREGNELAKIIGKSVVTAKSNQRGK
jgi:four helix bundle protein